MVLWLALGATTAHAQAAEEPTDQIRLEEILPVLEGSELGTIGIVPAPTPGTERRVRREEVLAALAAHGRDARGLDIPRSVVVRRSLRALDAAAVAALLRPVVAGALAPCELVDLRGPTRLELGPGAPRLEAEIAAPLRAEGSVGGVVRVREAGREQRVSVRATVRCPEPEVAAGARVRVVVRIGAVQATATGVARQTGRSGDVIRVTNDATRATLLARIVDRETVEVVR
ncbi:MAG: flagella basal body P-ring formation protein FlgA [Sandaracinus sp.]|nr:flagella basal body P-ring formation protein FlgA [Sandaracinus sp.]MCB9632474.1 flagella basal body P-ring formation protein FlgA [Sandaracinus sp.]